MLLDELFTSKDDKSLTIGSIVCKFNKIAECAISVDELISFLSMGVLDTCGGKPRMPGLEKLREHDSSINYHISIVSLQNFHWIKVQLRYLGQVFHHS